MENGRVELHIESLTLENFRCFGPQRTQVPLQDAVTAFIGPNGAGKTAACQAVLRLFGVTAAEREIRPDDFHTPASEKTPPVSKSLRLEAVLAFPELDEDETSASDTIPSFFHRMAATHDGKLKCRIVLEATWTKDATLEGNIESNLWVVSTHDDIYTPEQCTALRPAERSRIQVVYIPSSRDGARHVTSFLRGRLWRAAQWSDALSTGVAKAATDLNTKFRAEKATQVVQEKLSARWGELHGTGVHGSPIFVPLEADVGELVRDAELKFSPDHTSASLPASRLSDGQRSLLHIALTAVALDVEAGVADGSLAASFALDAAQVPLLTVLAVEEPENSLTPFYLSRIVAQLLHVCAGPRVQSLIASHSPGVVARIEPEAIRHFRLTSQACATVSCITLPADKTEAGKFVREAVRAHPELYFAHFVILGEGDTEEVVIPRIAQAQGITLDPSFVAMVPLGGRHTNHFWTLLNNLAIPHATLIDLDYGRSGAGAGRLRDACRRLQDAGVDVFGDLDGYDRVEDLKDTLTLAQQGAVMAHLRKFGVFFSEPLDLDMSMLTHYWDAYTKLDKGERGPDSSDAIDTVLGAKRPAEVAGIWMPADPADAACRKEELRWYRYLFLSRSKPASHLRAMGNLDDAVLLTAPASLQALISYVQKKLA